MSYSGPCAWVEELSAFCTEGLWSENMHRYCAGTFIARNPPPSGQGRTYSKCPCGCHANNNERWIQANQDQRTTERFPRTQGSSNGSLGTAPALSRQYGSSPHGSQQATQLQRELDYHSRLLAPPGRKDSLQKRKKKGTKVLLPSTGRTVRLKGRKRGKTKCGRFK